MTNRLAVKIYRTVGNFNRPVCNCKLPDWPGKATGLSGSFQIWVPESGKCTTDRPGSETDKPQRITDKPLTLTDKPGTVTDRPTIYIYIPLQPVGFQICGYKKVGRQMHFVEFGLDLLRDNWCAAFQFLFFFLQISLS